MGIRQFHVAYEKALPVRFESLYLATLPRALRVTGLDETRRARLLSLDSQGEVADLAQLPLAEVTGAAPFGERLAVAGIGPGDMAQVLCVAPDGNMEWQHELPVEGQVQHWPRPVERAEGRWLLAITSRPSGVRIFALTGNGLGQSYSHSFPDDSDGIDASWDAEGILLARIHADSQRLELLRLDGDRLLLRIEIDAVRPVAPSLAHLGNRIALAWISEPGELRLQWLDTKLNLIGGPEVLPPPSQRGVAVRVQLVADRDNCAVLCHCRDIVADGGISRQPDGTPVRRPPPCMLPLYVADLDTSLNCLGRFRLVTPDAKVYAARWIAGRLAVAHRGAETMLSMLELGT